MVQILTLFDAEQQHLYRKMYKDMTLILYKYTVLKMMHV